MNLQTINTIIKTFVIAGKELIDHWHEKKLEQDRIKRCHKVMPNR